MASKSASTENFAQKAKQEKKTNGSGDASPTNGGANNYSRITKLRNFLSARRLELGMLVSRIICVYYTVFYIIPIFGRSSEGLRRALIANILTSAMRLYQRLRGTPFSLSKEYIAHLIIEDSCHYIFYSITFIYFGSISFCLIPILLFSSLNVANFSLQMLEVVGGPTARLSGIGSLFFFFTSRTPWILKMAATSEIALMIVILLNCFRGKISIVAVIVYYRFLYLRYASKRNQYTRVVFYEMRMAAEAIISKGCPVLFARIIQMCITILCKLAPASAIRSQ